MQVVELQQVSKRFGKLVAVDQVDLQISEGSFCALLGPNGAGKTTLVEMIEGIQQPTQGSIRLFGLPWKGHETALQQKLGLSLQQTDFPGRLQVLETLEMFASFYQANRKRAQQVLERIRLQDKAKTQTRNLSGGQKQRLALGVALLNHPRLLLLDEPTTGLDPSARRDLWDILEEIRAQGTTLILTTHYMEEAEALCERILFMNGGRILADGDHSTLLASLEAGGLIEFSLMAPGEVNFLLNLPGAMKLTEKTPGLWQLSVKDLLPAMPAFFTEMAYQGLTLRSAVSRKPDLNDLFLSLTGRGLDD